MTAFGMPGVSTWNFGEAFSHLYLDSVAMNHNSIGRGYETCGNGTAETIHRTIPQADLSMEWYRPLPPPRDIDLVRPRQCELHGNRLARRSRLRRSQFQRNASQFLQKRLGFLAQRTRRSRRTHLSFLKIRATPRASRKWSGAFSRSTSKSAARKALSISKKEIIPPALTSFASISPIAITPSICSLRSIFPRVAASLTTTSPGNCPHTIT